MINNGVLAKLKQTDYIYFIWVKSKESTNHWYIQKLIGLIILKRDS